MGLLVDGNFASTSGHPIPDREQEGKTDMPSKVAPRDPKRDAEELGRLRRGEQGKPVVSWKFREEMVQDPNL